MNSAKLTIVEKILQNKAQTAGHNPRVLYSVVMSEMGRYPSGVRSPFDFGRQTMIPCFCWEVILLCRNIGFKSSSKSGCIVSQLAVKNCRLMPSMPGALCRAPFRRAERISPEVTGCSSWLAYFDGQVGL